MNKSVFLVTAAFIVLGSVTVMGQSGGSGGSSSGGTSSGGTSTGGAAGSSTGSPTSSVPSGTGPAPVPTPGQSFTLPSNVGTPGYWNDGQPHSQWYRANALPDSRSVLHFPI